MEKYTKEDILDRIEGEGIEYAILDYLSPDMIEDKKLAKLVRLARTVFDRIKDIQETYKQELGYEGEE